MGVDLAQWLQDLRVPLPTAVASSLPQRLRQYADQQQVLADAQVVRFDCDSLGVRDAIGVGTG